jgi:hypothetical protein
MRLLVFFLFIVGCWCNINVVIDPNGAYNITVNNQVWLRSSRTAIYVDDKWYSTENSSLTLVSITTAQGTDGNLGAWNETRITYNLVRTQTTTPIAARIRQWSIVPAFTFYLETGSAALTNKIALDMEQIRTVFPSFYIEKRDATDQRGYFTFGGGI